VVVSDPEVAKSILLTNAKSYSKGLLAEILEFVMGTGLIPADGEIWRIRRRSILPSLHKKYVEAMVGMFGACALHGSGKLAEAAAAGRAVEMENFFSRLSLDIIGKAVFNYEFDSLTNDDPVISAVYTVLREAEHRSIAIFPYWNFPGAQVLVPRQRAAAEALQVIEATLNKVISECKAMVEAADEEFVEEYLNRGDPSILRFLIASGDKVSSKQLRDDLMTLLIAGHETTAAVLTWTFYLLARHPEAAQAVRNEVDAVLGDRAPSGAEDLKALRFTTRVINEVRRAAPRQRPAQESSLACRPSARREVASCTAPTASPGHRSARRPLPAALTRRGPRAVDAPVPAAAGAAAARDRGRADGAVRGAGGERHLHQHVESAPLAAAVGPAARL